MPAKINVDHNAGQWNYHEEYIETWVGDMQFRTPIQVLTPQPEAGVQHRTHGVSGINIYMYNARPGYYYDEQGHEVSPDAAISSGFPVEEQMRERKRREATSLATEKIEAEFKRGTAKEEILVARGNYKVVKIAGGLFNIVDAEDSSIRYNVSGPLPQKLALEVLDALVPPEVQSKEKVKEPA